MTKLVNNKINSRHIISTGLAAATLAVVLTYVIDAPTILDTTQAEDAHTMIGSMFGKMHGIQNSTMQGMSGSQMKGMNHGLIGNNILGSPKSLSAGGLAVFVVAGAITFAIAAFVISWKQRSYLVAGLLAASGVVLIILPLANLNFVIPGPIIGVVVALAILGLGVIKGIRTVRN